MSVYYWKESKVKIKVIDQDDLNFNKVALPIKPRSLKNFIRIKDSCTLYVTATMPDVFLYFKWDLCETRIYHLPYRVFLGFVSELEMLEDPYLDWRECGF